MKILLDENLPNALASELEILGHDVKSARSGSTDEEVAALAQKDERVLLTLDKDFADILAYPPRDYCGIICIRINRPLPEEILNMLKFIFKRFNEKSINGKLIVVQPGRFRVRSR